MGEFSQCINPVCVAPYTAETFEDLFYITHGMRLPQGSCCALSHVELTVRARHCMQKLAANAPMEDRVLVCEVPVQEEIPDVSTKWIYHDGTISESPPVVQYRYSKLSMLDAIMNRVMFERSVPMLLNDGTILLPPLLDTSIRCVGCIYDPACPMTPLNHFEQLVLEPDILFGTIDLLDLRSYRLLVTHRKILVGDAEISITRGERMVHAVDAVRVGGEILASHRKGLSLSYISGRAHLNR